MSRKYKFHNKEGLYFVSFATVYWLDIFVRDIYFDEVLEPEHWKYSSAIDFAGGKGLLEIDVL
ncbi:MAG: hypothetical protein JXQ90_09580 [Cyclobacteriaceae bacterium]